MCLSWATGSPILILAWLWAVMLALVSGVGRAFGEVQFGELKLWLKEKMRRRRKRTNLIPSCGRRMTASLRACQGGVSDHGSP